MPSTKEEIDSDSSFSSDSDEELGSTGLTQNQNRLLYLISLYTHLARTDDEKETWIRKPAVSMNSHGTMFYGMQVEAVLDRIKDNISLDHLSRLLVDVQIDSSKIVDSVISQYQRDLLSLIFMGDAPNRNKINLIGWNSCVRYHGSYHGRVDNREHGMGSSFRVTLDSRDTRFLASYQSSHVVRSGIFPCVHDETMATQRAGKDRTSSQVESKTEHGCVEDIFDRQRDYGRESRVHYEQQYS